MILRKFCLALIASAFFYSTLAAAESADQARDPAELLQELEALEAEIQKFKDMLKRTEGERSELESSLENNEQSINQILKSIDGIQTDLKKGEDKLSSLSNQQSELEQSKLDQQDRIIQHVRAAYELGNTPQLKVLLNQEQPQKIERMMSYYQYINEARNDEIQTYERTIEQLANLEILIEKQNTQLRDSSMQLKREQAGLVEVRQEKQEVLDLLNAEILAAGDQLEQKLEDRARLDDLINRISAGISNLTAQTDTRPFAEMKGNLLLPVHGDIAQKFGSRRSAGKLRWEGLVIAADEGTPVHAVHYGRVVFSDWLRGFGLLLIISHGDGYMSLYGHNQVLYREAGDWISAGETIAAVGNSGGQERFGLYFEIRTGGKPANPTLWCQARPAARAA